MKAATKDPGEVHFTSDRAEDAHSNLDDRAENSKLGGALGAFEDDFHMYGTPKDEVAELSRAIRSNRRPSTLGSIPDSEDEL